MQEAFSIIIIVAAIVALKLSQSRRTDRYRSQMNRDVERLAEKSRRAQ